MVLVSIRSACERDIRELVSDLASDDQAELLIQGVDPEWAIRHSINIADEYFAIFGDGRLACMTGIAVDDGLVPHATPWLLGTSFMQEHPREVLRYSKLILNSWKSRFPFMFNYVDTRHKRAIAWLRHLGAQFELIPEHGPYKKPFYRFTFGEDPCASQ